MKSHLLRIAPLVLIGASACALGCHGYTSQYAPPPDGKPRLVWDDDKVVVTAAGAMPGECTSAVESVAGGGSITRYRGSGGHVHVSGGYYVPVRTVAVVRVGGGGGYHSPATRTVIHGSSVGHSSSGGSGLGKIGGGGSSGGGGDLGKAAIVLVVVAVATLPFIALGLAVGRPEPEKEVAASIDRFNAHTDLARTEGSPCDELVVAGQVAQ